MQLRYEEDSSTSDLRADQVHDCGEAEVAGFIRAPLRLLKCVY